MALDTRDKRASALGASLVFLAVLPLADSGLNTGDRAQVWGQYSGYGEEETGGAYERSAGLTVGAGLGANQNISEETLGYTAEGDGTGWGFYTSLACANWDDASAGGGETRKAYIYAKNDHVSTAAVVKIGLYTHNGTTNRPDDRIATAEITVPANSAAGWYSADITATLTGSTRYWLGQITLTGPTGFGIRWFSRDDDRHIYLTGQTDLPDPWPASGARNKSQWLVYLTYGSEGGGPRAFEGSATLGIGVWVDRETVLGLLGTGGLGVSAATSPESLAAVAVTGALPAGASVEAVSQHAASVSAALETLAAINALRTAISAYEGTAALSVGAAVAHNGLLALLGSGALETGATLDRESLLGLFGIGSLAVTATLDRESLLGLFGSGSLAVAAEAGQGSTVGLLGSSTVSAIAALNADSLLAALASAALSSSAYFDGSSAGAVQWFANAVLSVAATLPPPSGQLSLEGQATLAQIATLDANARRDLLLSTSLGVLAGVQGIGRWAGEVSAPLSMQAQLQASVQTASHVAAALQILAAVGLQTNVGVSGTAALAAAIAVAGSRQPAIAALFINWLAEVLTQAGVSTDAPTVTGLTGESLTTAAFTAETLRPSD